jgi:hypothetical protein
MDLEVDDILRELLREPGVVGAAVARGGETPATFGELEDLSLRRAALGGGAELVVAVSRTPPAGLDAAIERASRELRAWMRIHGGEPPEVALAGRAQRSRAALLGKIERLLDACAAAHGALGAALLRGSSILAVGGSLGDDLRDRLAFLRKRIDAEAARRRGRSSHAEIVGEDVYACSFWFDAYLVLFFDHPWPVDFVRYRARMVSRELAAILPHLDEDPTTPANVRPLPPRPSSA